MPRSVTRFSIQVPGGIRTLFTVVEKPNGELIIPLKGAQRFGADWATAENVLEQRYSIHPSPRSKDFNVIKLTLNLESGRSVTTVALTDAAKLKNGFSIVFVRRCQRLIDSEPEQPNPKEKTFSLARFDPALFNFIHALFVGHPETNFTVTDPNVVINSFSFRRFKLVIMASLYQLPSHHTTEFLHSITCRQKLRI